MHYWVSGQCFKEASLHSGWRYHKQTVCSRPKSNGPFRTKRWLCLPFQTRQAWVCRNSLNGGAKHALVSLDDPKTWPKNQIFYHRLSPHPFASARRRVRWRSHSALQNKGRPPSRLMLQLESMLGEFEAKVALEGKGA